jgi:DNA-binding NarL/FixJ family response regulator
MKSETILYVFDSGRDSSMALAALRSGGYEVVSTNSAMQAIALLFILHPIAAVVVDHRQSEATSFDVARSLKAVRPDVPIVLLCSGWCGRLPPSVDASLSTGRPLTELISALRRLLTAKSFPSEQRTMVS